jgi:hypothetical protein
MTIISKNLPPKTKNAEENDESLVAIIDQVIYIFSDSESSHFQQLDEYSNSRFWGKYRDTLGFEFLLMKVTGVCWMDELITMRAFI